MGKLPSSFKLPIKMGRLISSSKNYPNPFLIVMKRGDNISKLSRSKGALSAKILVLSIKSSLKVSNKGDKDVGKNN